MIINLGGLLMKEREILIPAKYAKSFEVNKGEYIIVTDVEGKQVADFIAFNRYNLKEYLSTAHTRTMGGKLTVSKGDYLYSNYRNSMFQIVEDTVGIHDTLYPCCDPKRYSLDFGVDDHRSCRENFVETLTPYEIGYSRIPDPLNLFQNSPVNPDGILGDPVKPESEAGDYVIIKSFIDTIVSISACPMDLVPTNAWNITDIKVKVTNKL